MIHSTPKCPIDADSSPVFTNERRVEGNTLPFDREHVEVRSSLACSAELSLLRRPFISSKAKYVIDAIFPPMDFSVNHDSPIIPYL